MLALHLGIAGRVEQDLLNFCDIVNFDVLVSLLVSKILIRNVLFLSRFQDLYFKNLDLVSTNSFENLDILDQTIYKFKFHRDFQTKEKRLG